MNDIVRAARAARRRLLTVQFVRLLADTAFWLGLAVAALVLLHRLLAPLPPAVFAVLPAAAAPAVAAWAFWRRPTLRTAALALDRSCGLEERVSSALYVRGDESPAAQAVLRDAEAAVKRSPLRPPPFEGIRGRRLALPASLLLLAALVPLPAAENASAETADDGPPAFVPEPVRKKESERLRRRAFHLEKRAREMKDPDLKTLAEAMRKVASELRKEKTTRNEALAKISSLEEKMREKREAVSKRVPEGLMRRYSKSGAENDNDAARRKMDELSKKLSECMAKAEALREKSLDGKETSQEQQELRDQLRELAREMRDAAGKEGLPEDIEQRLADMLDGRGLDNPDALEGLEAMLDDFEGLLGESELFGLLQEELFAMEESKDEFAEERGACGFCGSMLTPGESSCGRCRGLAAGDQPGTGDGSGPGDGFGRGPGRGPKGEANPEDELFPTKVTGPLSAGDIIGSIQFRSLPRKGELHSSYSQTYRSLSAEAAEALQQEEIPPGYRLHVRDYFDSIRPDKENK